MGYHVTILKTEAGEPISLTREVILKGIKNFPKFTFVDNTVYRNGEFFLDYSNGELWLKNPDEKDLEDMISIANNIGARVRGDEYETYESCERFFIHPDDEVLVEKAKVESESIRKKTKRNQFILNASIFSFFLCLVFFFKFMGWLE